MVVLSEGLATIRFDVLKSCSQTKDEATHHQMTDDRCKRKSKTKEEQEQEQERERKPVSISAPLYAA